MTLGKKNIAKNGKQNRITRFLCKAQASSKNYLRIFNFFSFQLKIWFNQLMDDHHLSYITKLEENNTMDHNVTFLEWELDVK